MKYFYARVSTKDQNLERQLVDARAYTSNIDRDVSYMTIANKLGYKHASAVSNRLDDKRSIQVDNLINILKELDCELVIRSTKKTDKREWVINIVEESK